MQGLVYCWIGLMGLAGAAGVFVLLRLFPRAFAESGPAVAWPLQRAESRSARIRGWLIVAAALLSAIVAVAGIVSLLA
jgi:hypothetical protein